MFQRNATPLKIPRDTMSLKIQRDILAVGTIPIPPSCIEKFPTPESLGISKSLDHLIVKCLTYIGEMLSNQLFHTRSDPAPIFKIYASRLGLPNRETEIIVLGNSLNHMANRGWHCTLYWSKSTDRANEIHISPTLTDEKGIIYVKMSNL